MRCPKCGYISFDHLDSCKKCHKKIDESSIQFNGTTYDTTSPSFLKFETKELEDHDEVQAIEQEQDISEDDRVIELADFEDADTVDEEPVVELDEIAFDLDDGNIEEEEEDIVLNLDDLEDAGPLEEFDTESEIEEEASSDMPPLDFGDLDISDLAPGEAEDETPEQGVSDETVETSIDSIDLDSLSPIDEPEQVVAEETPKTPEVEMEPEVAKEDSSPGLEDLLLDELDFNQPAKVVGDSPKAKSIKTGTALDNFDIDLGDLFTEKEK